ncbi:hypothetical protein [Simplicispira suum]|uniref:DUF1887 domain-containing protein n=1 Tax=Simplicispira suum TaxID=2109915 RepID=A0A2S0N1P6_9BURK|nr:hypothetical protein [Simplicispira suum]AVO42074.1 hypothetical protein C6571_12970 [Simplicispira suum]
MPIYRCNQCGLVAEGALLPVGAQTPCSRCGTPSTVFGTVFYVEKLVERYFAATRELTALRASESAEPPPEQSEDQPGQESTAPYLDVDLHNTSALATPEQHAPLQAWFAARQIEARFDPSLIDTSGFFDDAARLIGDGYALFGELMERIRFAYRKSHSWVNLELANLSQKDAQAINTLCRQLYSHTFFARYHYQKAEKIVRLTLQPAPAVRQFFDGGWLEWYVFMLQLERANQSGGPFSCARGVKVVFPNEDLHELDVLCLPQGGTPLCIECKSGEFRRDIDKYLRLRKRLGLPRSHFVICATDLDEEQAAGLTAMYELTFLSLRALPKHLKEILRPA